MEFSGVIEEGVNYKISVVDMSLWCYMAPCKGKLGLWPKGDLISQKGHNGILPLNCGIFT